jgi:hypothetical protein
MGDRTEGVIVLPLELSIRTSDVSCNAVIATSIRIEGIHSQGQKMNNNSIRLERWVSGGELTINLSREELPGIKGCKDNIIRLSVVHVTQFILNDRCTRARTSRAIEIDQKRSALS